MLACSLDVYWNVYWTIHWTVNGIVHGMYTGQYPGLYMGCTVDATLDCTWTVCSMYTGWYPGLYTALSTGMCPCSAHQVCPAVPRFAPNVSRCALGLYARCVPDVLAVLQLCIWTAHQMCSSCVSGPHTKCTPAVLQLCSRCIQLCSSCVQLCAEVSRCALDCRLDWTLVHCTVEKLKGAPACFLVHHGHVLWTYICRIPSSNDFRI